MTRCGSSSRCARSRARSSSPPTATRASGRRWTRCAIATTSSSYGAPRRLHGPHGDNAVSTAENAAGLARGVVDAGFWRGRNVLLTGHTGFKGAWLALWLQALGARVTGFSSGVPTDPSLYELAR